jgi:acyl-coenzyme A synthetase/AMP-(fatty) acid ligase/acyl carrier protein
VVNLAGEALPHSLAERLHADYPGVVVWNLYGPSEDTTYSTGGIVPHSDARPPSIGRPIRYKHAYILDDRLQPVPTGVHGELFLGGAGLARGYLRRPALTAARWIPHPFSPLPGDRLYRTGDLARWRPDGEIEFLGRIDQQVKLRGFRIELGEIEEVLGRHPAVTDCAVVVRDADEKSLRAFVVFADGPRPSATELRAHLARELPDYMVPAVFPAVGALPHTATGKLDRRALLAAAPVDEGETGCSFVEPRTALEKEVAALWCETLRLNRISADAGFFAAGGHSLQAARLVARLRDTFQIQLPLPRFFEEPTVAGIAKYIEIMRWAGKSRAGARSHGDEMEEGTL